MTHNIYVYILLAGLVSYLLRVLPVTIFQKPIKNRKFGYIIGRMNKHGIFQYLIHFGIRILQIGLSHIFQM